MKRLSEIENLKREIERLQEAKRRALSLADERAIEANGLRAKLAIARKALEEMASAPSSIAGRALIALTDKQGGGSRMSDSEPCLRS